MHMFRLGMEFTSTPHGYVVHSPHPVANSWNTTQSTGFWQKARAGGGHAWSRARGAAEPLSSGRLAGLQLLSPPFLCLPCRPRSCPTSLPSCAPLPSTLPSPLQLKKLYADSREDMERSVFVPATAFNCDSREPERWGFYRRQLRAPPL